MKLVFCMLSLHPLMVFLFSAITVWIDIGHINDSTRLVPFNLFVAHILLSDHVFYAHSIRRLTSQVTCRALFVMSRCQSVSE